MKRVLSLILVLCLLLTGCKNSNTEKAIRFDVESFPRSLDPQVASPEDSSLVLINTMCGLTGISKDGRTVPCLAKEWKAENGNRTYIFSLNKDLKWEDGRPLTAFDFLFALRRIADPNTNSPFAYRYRNIKNAEEIAEGDLPLESLGVKAENEDTLIIDLKEPDASFPSLMAQISSFPCNEEFFLSCKGKYGLSPEYFLSCGPFRLASQEEDLMLLKRNENAMESAKTEKLYFCRGRGNITDVFLDGRSEACIASYTDYEKLSSFPSDSFYNRTFSYVINPESEVGKNKIYRSSLMQAVLASEVRLENNPSLIRASGIIPPETNLDDLNYRDEAGEIFLPSHKAVSKIKEEVQEEISSSGKKFPKTEIITNEDKANFKIASEFQNIYTNGLSLYINILPLPSSDLAKKILNGDFEACISEIKPVQDKPSFYLSAFADTMITLGEEEVKVSDLLYEAGKESDKHKKIELLKNIEQALIDNFYILPLYHAPTYLVMSPSVSGIEYIPSRQTVFFGNAVLKS